VLSENIKDPELAKFYRDNDFRSRTLKFWMYDVDKRWKEWIEFETSIIVKYGKTESVHG
jgi:tRNA-(ms[2]io[6]A)-hydroxylase